LCSSGRASNSGARPRAAAARAAEGPPSVGAGEMGHVCAGLARAARRSASAGAAASPTSGVPPAASPGVSWLSWPHAGLSYSNAAGAGPCDCCGTRTRRSARSSSADDDADDADGDRAAARLGSSAGLSPIASSSPTTRAAPHAGNGRGAAAAAAADVTSRVVDSAAAVSANWLRTAEGGPTTGGMQTCSVQRSE
jgi:hypothetical protein